MHYMSKAFYHFDAFRDFALQNAWPRLPLPRRSAKRSPPQDREGTDSFDPNSSGSAGWPPQAFWIRTFATFATCKICQQKANLHLATLFLTSRELRNWPLPGGCRWTPYGRPALLARLAASRNLALPRPETTRASVAAAYGRVRQHTDSSSTTGKVEVTCLALVGLSA